MCLLCDGGRNYVRDSLGNCYYVGSIFSKCVSYYGDIY